MSNNFTINMDDKPNLTMLKNDDVKAFKEVVGTFVELMEISAAKKWHELPDTIHTSLSFKDIVHSVLNALLSTKEIDPKAYSALEADLHPLALISDKRKNLISGEEELYDWKSHFSLDSDEVSRLNLEKIIRKILYLVRWFDIESVSKSLITNQFPVIDAKDIMKLPFQPALRYQQQYLGDLFIGKFLHDIGAFNCGEIDRNNVLHTCPACNISKLNEVNDGTVVVCPRCNAGFTLRE